MRAIVLKTTPIIEKVITEEQRYIMNVEAVPPSLVE
jgi:hypothetical protein